MKLVLIMEEIPFFTKVDKERVFGIFTQGKENFPLLVLVHGWGGHHLGTRNRSFVLASRFFAKKGFNVVRFDFRGCGNSEGNFRDQTITSNIKYLKAIVNYCLKNFHLNKKIVLIGHSQGFYVSMFACKTIKFVKGLVSWMGRVSDLNEFLSKVRLEELKRRKILEEFDYYVVSEKYLKDSMKYNSSKLIKRLTLPVLLIYGERDNIVPVCEGLKFKRLRKKNVTLRIIKELNHHFEGEKVRKKVFNLTYKWIVRHIR